MWRMNLKEKNKPIDEIPYGGDGLPDWMQFSITLGMFGMLVWVERHVGE